MAGGALGKVVDDVAKAGKATARVDAAVQTASQAGTARAASTVKSDLQIQLADVMREQKEMSVAQGIEAERLSVKTKGQEELAASTVRQREQALYSPESNVDYTKQTQTPEEYERRVRDQLFDEQYALKSILNEKDGGVVTMDSLQIEQNIKLDELEASNEAWQINNEQAAKLWHSDAMAPLRNWTEGGVYTRRNVFAETGQDADLPVMFYHIDTMTDPNVEKFGEIQRTVGANEFGLHAGTGNAANTFSAVKNVPRATRGAIVDTLSRVDEFIAKETGGEPGIKRQIKEFFDATVSNTFNRSGQEFKYTNEIREELTDGINEILLLNADHWEAAIDDALMAVKRDPTFQALPLGQQDAALVNTKRVLEAPDPDRLASMLFNSLSKEFNSSGFALVTNTKNGLYMPDIMDWSAINIADNIQRLGIFPGNQAYDELAAIKTLPNERANIALSQFLKDRGHDHIVYPNMAEDKGSYSILLFDPDTWQNAYSPNISRGGRGGTAAAAGAFLAPLGAMLGLEEGG